MAEDLLPTIALGMVGIKNKKTGQVTAHFPVDAREILSGPSAKDHELVNNGAVEAARMNATPLHQLGAAIDRSLVHTQVSGIEGMVMVAMTPEQAEEFKNRAAAGAGQEKAEPDPKAGGDGDAQKQSAGKEPAKDAAKEDSGKK